MRNDCFALPPGEHWTPVSEALALLRERMRPVVGKKTLPLAQAAGRIAAGDISALRDSPPYANSAVDGYGLAHASCRMGEVHCIPLVKERAAAGHPFAGVVPPGHAIRILTGAAVPQGVDTILLQEDVHAGGGVIHFKGCPREGANLRQAGEDTKKGARLVQQGSKLSAARLAQLAAGGHESAPVYTPLKLAIISTGDEIIPPGAPANDYQIYDTNRIMLEALAGRHGFRVSMATRVGDSRVELEHALLRAAAGADAVLTTGGASGGDEDHLSASLKAVGQVDLWRVAIKPGRPLAMGTIIAQGRTVPVFGLPGNPVAVFVCFLIFLRPALLRMAGARWSEPQGFMLPTAFDARKKPGRAEYLRVRLDANGRLEKFHSEGSGLISGLSWADGLAALEHERGPVREGELVPYLPFSSLGI